MANQYQSRNLADTQYSVREPFLDMAAAQLSAQAVWRNNELILDKIMDLLPLEDLKSSRLACRFWAQIGGRILARKAVVRLTDWMFAGPETIADYSGRAFKYSSEVYDTRMFLLECPCKRSERMTRFFSIDHVEFKKKIWDSHFRPKKVILLGYSCARRLPWELRSVIQDLELTTYTGSQGTEMLEILTSLFPNVVSLNMKQLIPDADHMCTSHVAFGEFDCMDYCKSFRRAVKHDLRLAFPVQFRKWFPLLAMDAATCDTSKESDAPAASAPVSKTKPKSSLKKLSLQVSSHCDIRDWNMLERFSQLEVLEVLWWQVHPRNDYGRATREFVSCYPGCIEKMFPFMSSCTSLRHIHLSIDFRWTNLEAFERVLNGLNATVRVSLKIISIRWSEFLVKLTAFLAGLKDVAVQALDTLQIFKAGYNYGILLPVFQLLQKKQFFLKPNWNIVLQLGDDYWIRFRKAPNCLTLQTSKGNPFQFGKVYFELESLVACTEDPYNYAFHRLSSINDFENLNGSALFRPYFLLAHWTSMEHLVCQGCRDHPRLLCDLPGFQKEAQLSLPEPHPREEHVRTWTFAFVPREILAKWTVQLVSEISDWKASSACDCSCWDVVNRFKQIYAFQFTDADCAAADENEAVDATTLNDRYRNLHLSPLETTLASYASEYARAQVFGVVCFKTAIWGRYYQD